MKHWLINRANNKPPEWEHATAGMNTSSQTFFGDDGREYHIPVTKRMFPSLYHYHVADWPDGQPVRHFDKDATNLAFMESNGKLLITQSFLAPPFRTPENTRVVDLELMEKALEQHDWISLAYIVQNGEGVTQPALLKDSKYIVRGDNERLMCFETGEYLEKDGDVVTLTFFVAYRLGKTNGYVITCNYNILSIHGHNGAVGFITDDRTITSNIDQGNGIVQWALEPETNCEKVAGAYVVDKPFLELELSRYSTIYKKTDSSLHNIQYQVKSSWDVETEGNFIKVHKQPGVGYLKVTTDWVDMTKPYITAADRKTTLEYILLGV